MGQALEIAEGDGRPVFPGEPVDLLVEHGPKREVGVARGGGGRFNAVARALASEHPLATRPGAAGDFRGDAVQPGRNHIARPQARARRISTRNVA